MRAHLDAWAQLRKRRGRRTLWLTIGAVSLVLFGIFWALMGLMMAMTLEERHGVLSGMFCGAVLGVLPLIVGGVFGAMALRAKMRTNDYEELMVFLRQRGESPFTTAEVAQGLRLPPERAERLVLDLAAEKVLDDGVPELRASPFSPTVAASGVRSGPTLPSGTVLNGTWRVDELVGAGGMGHVYAVTHTRTGRRYALKTMLPDARLSADAVRRFEREARAASALGHPGIAAVHDFDQTPDGVAFFVMDLLEGETLEARLRTRGSLNWTEAQTLIVEIADALASAHAAGLLHRDVKPANVFLHHDGQAERAMLLDFGLAKPIEDPAVSRITATGEAVGTPLYMSPEQARGEALDVRTDVYGLAATIYEVVTGAPPFVGNTPALAYARLLSEPVLPASQVAAHALPPDLDALLTMALAKDPSERPTSVASFRDALVQIERAS